MHNGENYFLPYTCRDELIPSWFEWGGGRKSDRNSILIAMSSTLKDQQEQLSSIFNVLSNFSTDNVLKKAAEEGGRKENEDVDPL